MQSLQGLLHGIKWTMLHGHLDYIQEPPLGGRPYTKPGDHGIPNASILDLLYRIMCEDLHEQKSIEIALG